jgi:4-methyl-5(b-hydroxyethyl)-thiazole monophosphate biosynthesis
MKILLFLANGFETMEASVFIDVFGWSRSEFEIDAEVITCGFQKQVTSTFDVLVTVDVLLDEINAVDYDALVIPGGFEEYDFYKDAYDEKFLNIIREFDKAGKWIASVCVGALPIAKSGVLKGRNATTYHLKNGYRQEQLRDFGAKVVNKPIVIDHNIITSYCPSTAVHVAFELLEKMTSANQAQQVKKLMGYELTK